MTTKETSWGGVAEWYDDHLENSKDSYQSQVILPNLTRIISPRAGMLVADIACGQGFFSRVWNAAGATVIGCDISEELIGIARNKSDAGIEFFATPSDNLSQITSKSADVATIVLAIQNIENLQGTFSETSRILKQGGRLILVLNHPAFRIPQRSSWQWDESGKKPVEYRRLDAYMSDSREKIDMTPGIKSAAKKEFTVSFHRPLQTYFKSLAKAGFSVTKLEEWISHKKSQPGPRQEEEDRMRKEIPLFLCIEATLGAN
jgi:ubiquinone/menaquinone biosynthesis C-methylase UbiE